MPDQTPDYVPPPQGSGTGLAVGIVAIVLLVAVCGVGLIGFRFLAFHTVETRMPAPVDQEQIEVPLPADVQARESDFPAPEDSQR